MRFNKTLLLAFIVGMGCSNDDDNRPQVPQWKKLGLDGKSVNEMQIDGANLYVATTTGLFKREIGSANADFTLLGFEGQNVEAIEVVGPATLVVSIYDKSGAQPPALYNTLNDGEHWNVLENNFGGDSSEPVFDLEKHPQDQDVLYASGFAVVAKSIDQGKNWEPVYGNWGGFATGISVVEINPNDADEVWAGGQGAIENGFLLRSENSVDWDSWSDLVENPTVVKEIAFTPENREQLFVGFEGALLKTTNGGQHWQTLIESEDNRFFFGIGLRSGNAERMYAAGWLKTSSEQPLILYVSDTGGETFEELKFSPEAFGGVFDLQMKGQEDKDVLYLGLDKGGVYEVTFPH